MAWIEKRSPGYRVRYRDPLGKSRSRTFQRKLDADRFAREVEVDMGRGQWIDPRGSPGGGSAVQPAVTDARQGQYRTQ